MGWYIGLDIGTTNIKANAFCLDNGVQAEPVSVPTPRFYPEPDCENYELDTDALFDAAVQALSSLLKTIPASQVRGIGVSSLGESGVLVDEKMHSVCKAISWFDPRSQAQALALDNILGRERIYQITGQLSSAKYGLTKLLWTRENQPEVFASARMWMPVNSYILYRLSGKAACDYSIAARTMAFNIRKRQWSDELLAAAGLSAYFFPKAVPGGASIGSILPDLASALALPPDVQICTGGHDHACAAVGSGAIGEGCVLDSMGTAEVFMMAIRQPVTTRALYDAQVNIYPHCSPTLYRALTSMQACGASINWFLESIGQPIADQAQMLGMSPAAYMQKVAADAPDDALLHYFPFLRGSQSLPDSGGVFLGIRDQHGLPAFAKALLDGLCCEFNYQLSGAARQFGADFCSITAVGGPSQSDYFLQRKAAITGIPVARPASQEAASFGAAILAAIGCGAIDFDQAAKMTSDQSSRFVPESNSTLDTLYRNYARRRAFIEDCYR